MKIATVRHDGRVFPAIVRGEELELLSPDPDGAAAIFGSLPITRGHRTVGFPEVEFLPPVPRPNKIVCVGFNYNDHVSEAGGQAGQYPSLFTRFPDSFVGHNQPVLAPSISEEFDFEGELVVVIGKPCWRVPESDAMDYVGAFTCAAENSVRDFQFHSRQATPGKNFYASGAIGPWLTTQDEVADVAKLRLVSRLNGEVVQDGSLSDLIFGIPALIAYITKFTPLQPGDMISTGSPAGVGALRKPPLWLKPGDVFEVDIPGVGHLVNPVASDGATVQDFATKTKQA